MYTAGDFKMARRLNSVVVKAY